MALTATANEKVMNDVIDQLGINRCVLLTQSFNRSNLHYEVRPKKKGVMEDIAAFIRERQGETGIIYCMSRNRCEEVAKELREKYSIKSRHYHAHMSVDDKSRAQMAWQRGECQVIVATVCSLVIILIADKCNHRLRSAWESINLVGGRPDLIRQSDSCFRW
jgi:superfamily II DNA helicase RecQ